MSEHVIVSEAARTLSEQWARSSGRATSPRRLFYARLLEDDRCPIVGGRGSIPGAYFPTIADALRSRASARGGAHATP